MSPSHRERPVPRGLSVGAAPVLLATGLWAGACGRAQPPHSAPRVDATRTASAAPAPTGTSSLAPVSSPRPAKTSPVPPVLAPSEPASAVASVKTDAASAPCPPRASGSSKDILADLAALAKDCEKQTRRTLVGRIASGRQADQDRPQSVAFEAKANHCYRAYARATDGIKNLDLAIKDSFGYVAAEDTGEDGSVIVPGAGAVCFSRDDHATVVISVGMGNGSYALQIWGD